MKQPVILIILDGFGIAPDSQGNAIALAKTPVTDRLWREVPHTRLSASGEDVGLPAGQMGNSEVGHTNIGAGRVVYQELSRITRAAQNGELEQNPALRQAVEHIRATGGSLHFMGLLSDGGVHSHNTHLYAMIRAARSLGAEKIYVHAFLDGRDCPPKSGLGFVKELRQELSAIGAGTLATVCGRYYATDGDSVIFFNFRPDRARELTRALTQPSFDGFEKKAAPKDLCYVCTTVYDDSFEGVLVAFPPERPSQTLGEVVSQAGLSQLRIAETEKYAHVTFFLNGGREEPFPGEDRILVPSPQVATYDLQPEMSAPEVTEKVTAAIRSRKYGLNVHNVANCDMVGHTGSIPAAVQAVETVDRCLGEVLAAAEEAGMAAVITADHGNADEMLAEDGGPKTSHTTNPVPLWVTVPGLELRSGGRLADLAPTVLELMGLSQPDEMTGTSLIV